MQIKSKTLFYPLALGLLLFVLVSCGSRTDLVGTYVSEAKDSPKQSETSLELKENGVGVWKVGDEEVPFSWDFKRNQLRVNTKAGGVIVGSVDKDIILISLPGWKEIPFKKVQ